MIIEPMKAITVHNPWSWLLAILAKKYETRSWATKYRGPIAIHAGLAYDNCFLNEFAEAAHAALKTLLPGFSCMHELPRGCVIATAELVQCWEVDSINRFGDPFLAASNGKVTSYITITSKTDQLFGDFTPGRFAWEFANMRMLDMPIPAKGKQGLWNWEGVA